MATYMITASATRTGRPLYLRADGTWTERFTEGHAVHDEADRERLLAVARAEEQLACDAYWIEIVEHAGTTMPMELKDRSRLRGPTISYGEWR